MEIVPASERRRKLPNCLTENVSEMESLPHRKNVSEICPLVEQAEGRDEAGDERKEGGREIRGGSLPQGDEERKGSDAGCVGGVPLAVGAALA